MGLSEAGDFDSTICGGWRRWSAQIWTVSVGDLRRTGPSHKIAGKRGWRITCSFFKAAGKDDEHGIASACAAEKFIAKVQMVFRAVAHLLLFIRKVGAFVVGVSVNFTDGVTARPIMRNYHGIFRAPAVAQDFSIFIREKLQTASKSCRHLGALILATGLLTACATQDVERPVAQMTRAETAVQNAIQAGAREAAPRELQSAQRHLSEAQEASADENFLEAKRLAEKAEVDAQVAEATARSEETYETVAELQEGIRALEEELQREGSPRQQNVN